MVHPQRPRALVRVRPGLRAHMSRLGRDKLERRAGSVINMQRLALERQVDKARFDALGVEMCLGLNEVAVSEHAEADTLANRLARRLFQREAVMTALLDAVQPNRVVVF